MLMPRNAMANPTDYILNPRQLGGIDSYTIADGEGRGVRALCVDTGAGLRYRVLVDRGLDIDHAFFRETSLAYLSHKSVTPPTRAFDRGTDWLKAFPGGLLTSCGPLNMGGPSDHEGAHYAMHGSHSTTAATLESVIQPDPVRGQRDMTIVGTMKHGALYGPALDFRRTYRSTLGRNSIRITDEFYNAYNVPCPHAWLLHINFGYPLLAPGSRFCYASNGLTQREGDTLSRSRFSSREPHVFPEPSNDHRAELHAFSYLNPIAPPDGKVTVAIVNPSLKIGVAIRYDAQQFPQCGNWQHFGRGEYVAALEPMNGSVEGRAVDVAKGIADTIQPGGTRRYDYEIEVVTGTAIDALLEIGPR